MPGAHRAPAQRNRFFGGCRKGRLGWAWVLRPGGPQAAGLEEKTGPWDPRSREVTAQSGAVGSRTQALPWRWLSLAGKMVTTRRQRSETPFTLGMEEGGSEGKRFTGNLTLKLALGR